MAKKKQFDDITIFMEYNLDLATRTLYVGSEVSDEVGESGVEAKLAEKVIKGLHILDSQYPNGDNPINLILNNPGGSVYHGFAMYDAIRACKNPVKIKVLGHAMSMACVVLQAGTPRIMTPNSRLMIHYGSFSLDGHSKSALIWAKEEEKTNKIMEQLFLEKIRQLNPNFKLSALKEMLAFDTILDAEQALALGLIDEIEVPAEIASE